MAAQALLGMSMEEKRELIKRMNEEDGQDFQSA
jgi:hypothetical protein